MTDERQAGTTRYGAAIPYSEDIGHMWDMSRTRLALEILISEYPWPDEVSGDFDAPAALDVLGKLDQSLRATEIENLRACGITDQYLIIRPWSRPCTGTVGDCTNLTCGTTGNCGDGSPS